MNFVFIIIIYVWLFFTVLQINFSLVPRIIFQWYYELFFTLGIENYFFIELRVLFCGITNISFGLQYIVGLVKEGDLFECFPARFLYDILVVFIYRQPFLIFNIIFLILWGRWVFSTADTWDSQQCHSRNQSNFPVSEISTSIPSGSASCNARPSALESGASSWGSGSGTLSCPTSLFAKQACAVRENTRGTRMGRGLLIWEDISYSTRRLELCTMSWSRLIW